MHRATNGGRAQPTERQHSAYGQAPAGPESSAVRGGQGQRHSLRGDVEADIPVLPQHVQHHAHGWRPRGRAPLPPPSPPAAVATGAVPRAPAAIGIGCGAARGGERGGGARAPARP